MDEVAEILLCEVANEVEAALVVNLLNEDGIPARSDATQAMNVFGGLPSSRATRSSSPRPRREKRAKSWVNIPTSRSSKTCMSLIESLPVVQCQRIAACEDISSIPHNGQLTTDH